MLFYSDATDYDVEEVSRWHKGSTCSSLRDVFVGSQPLFPPCQPNLPPGISTWGAYPYVVRVLCAVGMDWKLIRYTNFSWRAVVWANFVCCLVYHFGRGVDGDYLNVHFNELDFLPLFTLKILHCGIICHAVYACLRALRYMSQHKQMYL